MPRRRARLGCVCSHVLPFGCGDIRDAFQVAPFALFHCNRRIHGASAHHFRSVRNGLPYRRNAGCVATARGRRRSNRCRGQARRRCAVRVRLRVSFVIMFTNERNGKRRIKGRAQ
eukprot:Amastigsp_a841714_446.p6 type:complete len:115 gc:universal Amastigsp_a841714_446:1103-759(-)